MPRIAVIGGSGLYGIPGMEIVSRKSVATPFGSPSSDYTIGRFQDIEIAFLPRHGAGHTMAPHRINYRANMYGFKVLGVERIIAVYATGGIADGLAPGDFLVPDQILDMTQGGRQATYYEEGEIVHVDFTDPYCPELRESLLDAGQEAGLHLHDGGTYISVQGPRLESRAEIQFYRSIGADVVGMTGMPEAILARELEICFGGVCVVTNYAAGISASKLTTREVIESMTASNERLQSLLREAFGLIPETRACACKDALNNTKM